MKNKIAIVVSSPMTLTSFMVEHIRILSEDYSVYLIANFSDANNPEINGVSGFININIKREITLYSDFSSLFTLIKVFRKEKFQSVMSITPKAGLLAMCASWLTFVPIRIHYFTGQVWVTKTGLFRYLLKYLDKLTAFCSTYSLVDSISQREFLISERVIQGSRSEVLAHGSISGVDINKFKFKISDRDSVRKNLNISNVDFVYLFIGRLCNDKGLPELIEAFSDINNVNKHVHLVLVGPNEGLFTSEYFSNLNIPNIHYVGKTSNPEIYYSCADVFMLPSHREGFGTVILEAAATKVPSIASNIYGLTDAVIDGKTGLLHEVKNTDDLKSKMILILEDKNLRESLSINAYSRVCEFFSSSYVSRQLLFFYNKLFKL